MPESVYKESYGTPSKPDRELVGAGDVPLTRVGFALMNLALDEIVIEERVFLVKGASKLLLGIPVNRSLVLPVTSQGLTVSKQSIPCLLLIIILYHRVQRRTL